jgi:hypothetical protein
MKAQRGSKGIVLLFNIGTQIGVGGQRHARDALHWERNPAPFEQEDGRAPRPVRTTRKISPQPRFDPRTVQPVASRHTDYTIQTHINHCFIFKTYFRFAAAVSSY